jgi:hypothetical protein
MESKTEIFGAMSPMMPTFEVKQGLVGCIGFNEDIQSNQAG